MTEFTFQPTFVSSVPTAIWVLTLVFGYLSFIGYLATYDLSYKPNPGMFINFLFDNYDGMNKFNDYIQASCKHYQKETFETTYSQIPPNNNSLPYLLSTFHDMMERWIQQCKSIFQYLLLKLYMNGNKIQIFKS